MSKVRENQEANNIDEVLSILEAGTFQELTWVGKNYSKADLIRDLKKLKGGDSEWISINKPPAFPNPFLVSNGEDVSEAIYTGLSWVVADGHTDLLLGITHWMPLPSPPNH